MNACPPLDDRTPVIVAARRSAIGRKGGVFAGVDVEALGAPVIRAALEDANVADHAIDDVILGNAAGPGGNIARLCALEAGLPLSVPGVTVDRQCGSGLEAVIMACRLVQSGAGDVFVAGGVESESRAPLRAMPARDGGAAQFYDRARFSPDRIGDPDMGVAAENVAQAYGISRDRQDRFALESHRRALRAQSAGRFKAEIVDIGGITQDESTRPSLTARTLTRLGPAFVEGGSVTAGNSCPLNDGAAALVVMSVTRARALGFERGLGFLDAAAAGVDPNLLGIGPVTSTRRLLDRLPSMRLGKVDAVEFNEAFAAQVLASLDELGSPEDLPNADGGAIALGHPFGASGAILVVRLFSQLLRQQRPVGATGLAIIGIGGGQGLSCAFEVRNL